MPGGVAGERPVKAVPYADAWNLADHPMCAIFCALITKHFLAKIVSFLSRNNRLFAASLSLG